MKLLPLPVINIKQSGFTLVELSIVMIIIGLLIGGIFGGMKLVENANVQKTIQDLKSFDAAGITFKDTYRALPGDMRNASTRLPNCTATPCATNGNGDRKIGGDLANSPIIATDEEFTFWSHLSAAGLISASIQPTTNLMFGEGQPETPINGGYRMWGYYNGLFWTTNNISSRHVLWMSDKYSDDFGTATSQDQDSIPCRLSRQVDTKMDDGMPVTGRVMVWGACYAAPLTATSGWATNASSLNAAVHYVLAF
ncbi:MAG: prepilin-type N-terminal cleavage/methylation domain-containing protein [Proteobacteria bacterium]|nr:prepilin-type N-terminal cleavage/methylation domain-containing protein [Pseudomonadota bacterium]